jgi:hypothetical protein
MQRKIGLATYVALLSSERWTQRYQGEVTSLQMNRRGDLKQCSLLYQE